jgi:hypothetical protein
VTEEVISLREYLEKIIELQFAAVRSAVDKAFDSKNEADLQVSIKIETLRASIERCLEKSEYEIRHRELVAKMEELWDFRTNVSGRETMLKAVWAILIAVAGLLIGYWMRR